MLRKLTVRGIEMELEGAGSGERAFVLVHGFTTDRLAEIRCPTLVTVGAEDAPFLAPADELERGIAGAERVTIERAAHSPQLENPPAGSAAIRAHLARVR
jgi:pimeloyl-ACP methyl ester carboxylesterase